MSDRQSEKLVEIVYDELSERGADPALEQEAAKLKETLAIMRSLPLEDPPRSLDSFILAHARHATEVRRERTWWRVWLTKPTFGAVVAAATVVVVVFWLRTDIMKPDPIPVVVESEVHEGGETDMLAYNIDGRGAKVDVALPESHAERRADERGGGRDSWGTSQGASPKGLGGPGRNSAAKDGVTGEGKPAAPAPTEGARAPARAQKPQTAREQPVAPSELPKKRAKAKAEMQGVAPEMPASIAPSSNLSESDAAAPSVAPQTAAATVADTQTDDATSDEYRHAFMALVDADRAIRNGDIDDARRILAAARNDARHGSKPYYLLTLRMGRLEVERETPDPTAAELYLNEATKSPTTRTEAERLLKLLALRRRPY